MKQRIFLLSLLPLSFASLINTANAATSSDTYVKCYGISKAGQNDCAGKQGKWAHGCAGLAQKDFDECEWKYKKKADCLKLSGKLSPAKCSKE